MLSSPPYNLEESDVSLQPGSLCYSFLFLFLGLPKVSFSSFQTSVQEFHGVAQLLKSLLALLWQLVVSVGDINKDQVKHTIISFQDTFWH